MKETLKPSGALALLSCSALHGLLPRGTSGPTEAAATPVTVSTFHEKGTQDTEETRHAGSSLSRLTLTGQWPARGHTGTSS